MKAFVGKIARFLIATIGPTAVEYAVILALIFLVCFMAVVMLGGQANSSLQNSSDEIRSFLNAGP